MEKENNSPEIDNGQSAGKIMPTIEEVSRIIGAYLGILTQFTLINKGGKYEIYIYRTENEKCQEQPKHPFQLNLKPLGEISDEDALFIAKYWYTPWSDGENEYAIARVKRDLANTEIMLSRESADYLRECGYALPYGPWSVEQLEEFGIYKLITE